MFARLTLDTNCARLGVAQHKQPLEVIVATFKKLSKPLNVGGNTYTHKCPDCGASRGWEFFSEYYEREIIECDNCLHSTGD